MINLTMFHTTDDLLELTGLENRSDLWDNGFNLDDWDAGFCSDVKLHEEHTDEDDEYSYVSWLPDADWLGNQMDAYCVGYNYCEYNGKHYYTVHHS